jgi:hypothetical protein
MSVQTLELKAAIKYSNLELKLKSLWMYLTINHIQLDQYYQIDFIIQTCMLQIKVINTCHTQTKRVNLQLI